MCYKIFLNLCLLIMLSINLTNGNCLRSGEECISLLQCTPYMDLIKGLEKPLNPSFIQFLRAKQCGFENGYPNVCCSVLPKALKIVQQIIQPHPIPISLSTIIVHPILITTNQNNKIAEKEQTTTEPSSTTTKNTKKLLTDEINNRFLLSDFFDYGSFDLFRKRRNTGDEIDIEIR